MNRLAIHVQNPLQCTCCTCLCTEAGRSDVESVTKSFILTPNSTTTFASFNIIDDDVLEFDEIFLAEFQFDLDIKNSWKTKKGMPSSAFIRIIDNDCELFCKTVYTHMPVPVLQSRQLSYFYAVVEVNVHEEHITILESEGQVSVSLRITGKFFIPLYAIIEVSNGTATG